MTLRKILKHIIIQLTPFYTLEIASITTFYIGYTVGSMLTSHPTLVGTVTGLIPSLITLYLLPSHFEKGNRFKLFNKVSIKNEYQTELAKETIQKLREIEKSMGISDNITYILSNSNSMGALKLNRNTYAVIIPIDFINKFGEKTYILTTHELAHIKLKHLVKMKYLYISLLTLSSLLTLVTANINITTGMMTMLVTPVLMNTLFIHFQRKWENEADQYAVKFVNPLEFSSMLKTVVQTYKQFEELNRLQEKYSTLFKLIIPHENIEERVNKINI